MEQESRVKITRCIQYTSQVRKKFFRSHHELSRRGRQGLNDGRSGTSVKKSESSGNVDASGRTWRNAGVGGKQLDGGGAPGEQAAGTHVAAAAVGDAAGNDDHQVEAFDGDAVAAAIQQSSNAGAGSSGRQFGTPVAAPCCSSRC